MLSEYLEIPKIYKSPEHIVKNENSVQAALIYYKTCDYKASSISLYTILASDPQIEDKAVIYNNLGCSEFGIGKYYLAKEYFTDALSMIGERDINQKVSIMLNLSFTQLRLADYPNAQKNFIDLITLLYSMKTFSKIYLALIYTGLTVIAREKGDVDDAHKNIELAHDLSQEFADTELTVVYIYEIYASIKRMKGMFQEGYEICQNNLKLLKQGVKNHPIEGMIKNSLALSLRSMADYNKALEQIIEGTNILKNFYDELHPDVALIKNTQGLIYHNMDQYHDGMTFIKESMKIYRYSNLGNHPDMAKFYNNLGLTYKGMSKFSDAIENYKSAIEVLTSTYGPDHSGIAPQYNNIGVAYKKMGQYRESLSCYLKCYTILEKSMTSNHPLVADILLNIGYLMHMVGSRDEVHPCFKRSMIIYSKFYGPKHVFTDKAKIKNFSTDRDKAAFSINASEV